MNARNVNLDFNYLWNLLPNYPKNNLKVFGSFLCGGGSTMGYKLAGYTHLGGIEIDKKISEVYKINHNPKYFYNEDIRDFNKRKDLPEELYNLDIFDGSPPCSSFSISGKREKHWGKNKIFKEGQSKQILDDLFYHWIESVDKLKPKIAIAENVTGIIKGKAKGYVIEINKKLNEIGYNIQIFKLNSSTMGVPQARERIFFICSKKELNYPKLKLEFNKKTIPFEDIEDFEDFEDIKSEKILFYLKKTKEGEPFQKYAGKGRYFNYYRIHRKKPIPTIMAKCDLYHYRKNRKLTNLELIKASSFPLNYNFLKNKVSYITGMSVPPIMMANIANEIHKQWLFHEN